MYQYVVADHDFAREHGVYNIIHLYGPALRCTWVNVDRRVNTCSAYYHERGHSGHVIAKLTRRFENTRVHGTITILCYYCFSDFFFSSFLFFFFSFSIS